MNAWAVVENIACLAVFCFLAFTGHWILAFVPLLLVNFPKERTPPATEGAAHD